MWLVAVVARCVVGCEHCEGYCSTVRRITFTVLDVAGCSYGALRCGVEHCEGYCSTVRTLPSQCPHPTTQHHTTATSHIQHSEGYCSTVRTLTFTVPTPQNATPQNCNKPHPALPSQTPYAVIHGLCYPDDGHNDARNTLRQLLIINI